MRRKPRKKPCQLWARGAMRASNPPTNMLGMKSDNGDLIIRQPPPKVKKGAYPLNWLPPILKQNMALLTPNFLCFIYQKMFWMAVLADCVIRTTYQSIVGKWNVESVSVVLHEVQSSFLCVKFIYRKLYHVQPVFNLSLGMLTNKNWHSFCLLFTQLVKD